MSAYGRTSTIPGTKETLVVGEGAAGVSGAGMDKQGGAGVRMTGQGCVGDGEYGPEVGAEGGRPKEGTLNHQGARLLVIRV